MTMLTDFKRVYHNPIFIISLLLISLMVVGARPEMVNLFDVPYDKVAHAIAYSAISMVVWWSLAHHKLIGTVVIATAIAVVDEVYQTMLPGRESDIIDFLVDLAAIVLTSLLFYWYQFKK
jgi:VanZ family protein